MATVFFDTGATLADVTAAPDGSLIFRPRPWRLRSRGVVDEAVAGDRLALTLAGL
ncbi:MAG TPA: hypothetical protein VJ617_14930 [Arthrobacter sp.]|nr:hypothetical protein [Arthrobacter sp.]